ncbi:MAG TPA: hypothetical protein VLA43_13040, partial [Longimicrobiales bacterium]|nr:hypothetical protein [Longimicrobiales bacterium]
MPPISSPAASSQTVATQWIVFGDDWGTHPSTTQHLILSLPPRDRVVWVESIGMRTPKINLVDARRIVQKAGRLLRSGDARAGALYERDSAQVEVVRPKVLPWHGSAGVRRLNGVSLARSVGRALAPGFGGQTVLLSSVPVVADYLDRFASCHAVAYLRLDDYAHYPGVDPELVEASETRMYERADVVFATSRQLLPPPPFTHKGVYLPQGVNWAHFAGASLTP